MSNVDLNNVTFADMAGAANFRGEDLKDEGPLDLTINDVLTKEFDSDKGGKETKWFLAFEEDQRDCPLNKTRLNAMKDLFGMPPSNWIGQRVRLFPTRVSYGGKMYDAIGLDGLSPHDPSSNGTAGGSQMKVTHTGHSAPTAPASDAELNKLVDAAKRIWGDADWNEMLKSHLGGKRLRDHSSDDVYKLLDTLDRAKAPVPASGDGGEVEDPFADI